jgi:hypothetical protein
MNELGRAQKYRILTGMQRMKTRLRRFQIGKSKARYYQNQVTRSWWPP